MHGQTNINKMGYMILMGNVTARNSLRHVGLDGILNNSSVSGWRTVEGPVGGSDKHGNESSSFTKRKRLTEDLIHDTTIDIRKKLCSI
jgi:hypothetical protein